MRILFLAPTLPIPASGGRTRLYNLIKQLATRHELGVLSFIQPHEHDMLCHVKPYCRRIELVPFTGFKPLGKWDNRLRGWVRLLFSPRPNYAHVFPVARMRPALRRLLDSQSFDLVVFEELYLVELRDEIGPTPVMLVEYNVESDLARKQYALAANPLHQLRDWLVWRKLVAFERRWARRFPVCAAVSEYDAALLREIAPSAQVYVVPNGVDSQHFAPAQVQRRPETLLFLGTLSYGPNADGLVWFCHQVLPQIRQARPNVELEVIGLNPPPRVSALAQLPGVRVTGFVPDVRPSLWSAAVCVVPLLVGGGTRLKILEAMAAGCPVVSTTAGAAGLDVTPEQHLLIADAPDAFARQTLRLLDSPNERERLAAAARQNVQQNHDWSQIAVLLEEACRQAVNHQGLAGL